MGTRPTTSRRTRSPMKKSKTTPPRKNINNNEDEERIRRYEEAYNAILLQEESNILNTSFDSTSDNSISLSSDGFRKHWKKVIDVNTSYDDLQSIHDNYQSTTINNNNDYIPKSNKIITTNFDTKQQQ